MENVDKELRIAQEMLFLVLDALDGPVFITDEAVHAGIQGDRIVAINRDEERLGWVVSLEDKDE